MHDLETHAPRLIAQLLEYGFAPVPPAPLPPEWQHVYEAVRAVRGDRDARHRAFLHCLSAIPSGGDIYFAVLEANPVADNTDRPERRVHSAEQALSAPPVIDWFVQGLFTRPSLNLLVGNPGTKKTFLALDLAVSVALGQEWLGRQTKPSPVLIVDEETGLPRLWGRLHSVLHAHKAPPETPLHYITLGGYDLRQRAEADSLARQAQALKVGLIIIDALVDVLGGGDENSVPSIQPVLNNLRRLSESCQAAVVLIHHTNKSGIFRGSSSISAAVDLMLSVQSETGDSLIHLRPLKARTALPLPFSARAHFQNAAPGLEERFWLTPTDELPSAKPIPLTNTASSAILDYLSLNGRATISTLINQLDAGTPGTIRKVIYELMAAGQINRIDGGRQGKLAVYTLSDKGRVALSSRKP